MTKKTSLITGLLMALMGSGQMYGQTPSQTTNPTPVVVTKIERNNHATLSTNSWIKILDKILPTARSFVLTGGECFLRQDIYDIAKYIKDYDSTIRLSCITNGMHDFKQQSIQDVVKLLNSVSFSCDSISREGERKGFNARLFRENIEYIRKNYPNLAITVSSTYTKHNYADLLEIESFCKDNLCWFTRNIVIPETTEDIRVFVN